MKYKVLKYTTQPIEGKDVPVTIRFTGEEGFFDGFNVNVSGVSTYDAQSHIIAESERIIVAEVFLTNKQTNERTRYTNTEVGEKKAAAVLNSVMFAANSDLYRIYG